MQHQDCTHIHVCIQNYSWLTLLWRSNGATWGQRSHQQILSRTWLPPKVSACALVQGSAQLSLFNSWNSATSITVLGTKFHPGALVCLKVPADEDYPLFAEVKYIFVPDDTKLLLVKKLSTTSFSNHYNAYHVSPTPSYCLVNVTDLALHQVFYLCTIGSAYYVTIKSCHHVELNVWYCVMFIESWHNKVWWLSYGLHSLLNYNVD